MIEGKYCRRCQEKITLENTLKAKITKRDWICKECFNAYRRELRAKNKIVYILWSGDKALYVGSTSNTDKRRMIKHIQAKTHLRLGVEHWQQLGLTHITYRHFLDYEPKNVEEIEHIVMDKLDTGSLLNVKRDYKNDELFDFQHGVLERVTGAMLKWLDDEKYWKRYPLNELDDLLK